MSPPASAAPPTVDRTGGDKRKDGVKTQARNRGRSQIWGDASAQQDVREPDLLPLDVPRRAPFSRVEGERRVLQAQLVEAMRRYDESPEIPRPEDAYYGTRSGYDVHLRREALMVLRAAMAKDYGPESSEARKRQAEAAERKVVLIAVMAVHMATRERLERLRHVLRSVQEQTGLPANTELVVAISWFSPTPEMAVQVEEVLEGFAATRSARAQAAPPAALAQGCPEIKVHSHEAASSSDACRPRCRRSRQWPFGRPRVGRRPRPPTSEWDEDDPPWGYDRPLYEKEAPGEPGGRGRRAPGAQRYSLCAEPLGFVDEVAEGPPQDPPVTILVRQPVRHTQFMHIRAAVSAAEAALKDRWSIKSGDEGKYSFWCIFGDDDDLWHPQRAAACAREINSHPLIEGVGIFTNLSRANVESEEITAKDRMPVTSEEVDAFLEDGRAVINKDEELSGAWLQHLGEVEDPACVPVPGNIDLEYFDFCPRLRLLHEFFENTSKFITRHRLCDLRLCEFLNSYSIRGKELGLYMHFFDPGHWMYFYANAFPSDEEWVAAIEDDQPQDSDLKPGHVGVKGGHVSTQVPITDIDITLANSACAEFKYWDEPMTEAKLARYLAYFRYYIEVGLVRTHTQTIDQREHDMMVYEAAYTSFLGFTTKMMNSDPEVAQAAGQLMLSVCQSHSKSLLDNFDVKVVWYYPDEFIYPPGGRSIGGVPDFVPAEASAEALTEEDVLDIFELPEMNADEVALVRRALERGYVSEASLLQVADVQGTDRDMVRRKCKEISKGISAQSPTDGAGESGPVAPHQVHVPDWMLDAWAQSELANEILRHYVLQGSIGEVEEMSFRDLLQLLKDMGTEKSEIVAAFDDTVQEEDVEAATVNVLTLYRSKGTAGAEYLRLWDVYRFLESMGMSLRDFQAHFSAAGFMHSPVDPGQEIILDSFRVLKALGQGMTGSVVYLAEDLSPEGAPGGARQQVALKWPVEGMELHALMAVQPFAEVRSGFPLMLGTGKCEDMPYLVTELLGSDLEKVFQRIEDCPLPQRWSAVRAIGRLLLRLLEAVHRSGWVHCDFGSHNVLLGRPRDSRQGDASLVVPYIIDFGCAQPHPGGSPLRGDVGSMEFSSITSASGGPRTPSDDLEALGWLMVHGVFGDLPWFEWLTQHYKLKPALKAVKLAPLLQRVQGAKRQLLDEGWGSLGAEWGRRAEMPSDLDRFMRLCQVEIGASELPDYSLLAGALGASYGLDSWEAEEEDIRRYKADVMPLLV